MKSKKSCPNMVNVLILNENHHALLINNVKHRSNRLEFPGGKLDEKFKQIKRGLELMAIKEAKQELDIYVKLINVNGSKIFGDYETQTPEGPFLCRTFYGKIISGTPKIMEPKIHGGFDYFNYSELLKFNEAGVLAPNLVLALPKLKDYVD